ncbi:MAG: hydrogenase iron-sulfur subunit [Candidatus Edwardsbacteria bacterium]
MNKIFVCDCRGTIKLPKDLNFGKEFSVIFHQELCSKEGKELVKKENRKPVIIAGCTPRLAERYFASANAEIVNIREQGHFYGYSPEKIKELIGSAVEKIKVRFAEERKPFLVKSKSVLVIGGGVAGLEAAKLLSLAGLEVILIEKAPFLGGMVSKLDRVYPEGTPNSHTLFNLINDVVTQENIKIYTSTELLEFKGMPGDFVAKIQHHQSEISGCNLCGECEKVCPVEVEDFGIKRRAIYYLPTYPDNYQIDWENCTKCGECVKVCPRIKLDSEEILLANVGAVIVASGLNFYDAKKITEYGYGRYDGVMTTLEFERKVTSGLINPQRVVIISCAGSRDKKYLPYCSRVCCLIGLKEAKLIKDLNPKAEVYFTYIDIRAYGEREKFYETLRQVSGVTFIKGKPSEVKRSEEKLLVVVEDMLLDEMLEIESDCVVLSLGFVPEQNLLKKLGIKTEPEKFPNSYLESSLSADSNPKGIFLCGGASFPVSVSEAIIDARNAAASVINLLKKEDFSFRTWTTKINSDICSALNCRLCVNTCPYGAIYEEEEKVKVNEFVCMGCGICSATCPAGANQLQVYSDKELLAQIKSLAKPGSVLGLLCKWSAYNAADKLGYEGKRVPENISILRIPCSGRVESQMILEALNQGAKGILIGSCYPDACHYLEGNFKARNRCEMLKDFIEQLNFPQNVLRLEWFGKEESSKLFRILEEMNR